jgi:hypothetical protein
MLQACILHRNIYLPDSNGTTGRPAASLPTSGTAGVTPSAEGNVSVARDPGGTTQL